MFGRQSVDKEVSTFCEHLYFSISGCHDCHFKLENRRGLSCLLPYTAVTKI